MGTEPIPNDKIRIFFFPYLTSGHFLPMLNMASLFSTSHPSVSSTVITTPSNAHLISSFPNLSLRILPLPTTSLPDDWDSTSSPTNSAGFYSVHSALSLLHHPLLNLLKSEPPHCLVSDMFLPWTVDVTAELSIPRIVFHGMSSFSLSVIECIKKYRPHDLVSNDLDRFVVPSLPHPVVLTRSQLPVPLRARTRFNSLMDQMDESNSNSYGVVVNSFYELEDEFAAHYKNSFGGRAWLIGPVSISNRNSDYAGCLGWLDSKKPDSVLYVCFGSQTQFTTSQLSELALGLASSKHYYILVVRKDSPEFCDIENEKGMIIRGWVSQVQILNHSSVGGFLTHCGWNSVLEGVSAGKAMLTWPVFGDQPFNEKLIVDELRIGVRVGVGIGNEGEEEVVKSGEIARAVERVMGEGEEAMEMRRKVKKLGEKARGAVKEGGSSWKDMNCLIEELMSLNKDLMTSK